jgi:hypothetical protein
MSSYREWIDRSIIQGKKKGEWVLDSKGDWVWLDSIEGS